MDPDVRNRLAKAAGAEVAVQQTDENGTPLWREAHVQVIMHKTPESRGNFASSDPEKWYATVAGSALASQNVQNTSVRERFWQFRSGKMVRHCGAKRICKSKCAKHHALGPIFAFPIWKNGTPLWREAHLQVKMHKTPDARATF